MVKFSNLPQETAPALTDFLAGYKASGPTTEKFVMTDLINLFGLNPVINFAPPTGFLINGKITTSVASNDLTVAVKTLAGNDPSTASPVYVRIGNTVRTITAALSVTKNDGTNWFGAGGAMFATQEIDYFVYFVWNTTDNAVSIAFSRIPSGRVYSDFSSTTTNEKYLAYSGSAPASTDECANGGRFNAILSATASFNWSLPATSIVITRPIFTTRVLSYTPDWTGAGGNPAIGNGTLAGKYQVVDTNVYHQLNMTAGSTTTFGSGTYRFAPAFTINSTGSTLVGLSGYGYIEDAGIGANGGMARAFTATAVDFGGPANGAVGAGDLIDWGATSFFTVANGDFIRANFITPI